MVLESGQLQLLSKGNKISIIKNKFFTLNWSTYSAFTYYTGFRNSGEYKARFGSHQPKYVDLIFKELIDVKDDGSFRYHEILPLV